MLSETRPLRVIKSSSAAIAARAVPRLRKLASVLVVLSALLALATLLVIRLVDRPQMHAPFVFAMIGCMFAASIGMAVVTRLPWRPARIANVGFVFQLLGALCIALVEEQAARQPAIGAVGIWILSFPLVPQTPRRAVTVAFGAATANLVAYAVHVALGHRDVDPWALVVAQLIVNGLCALLSVFTSKVIYSLGREVETAKQLGAYQLVERLGHGGMGEVWRAKHRTLVRPAAIELIRPEAMSGLSAAEARALRARFEREVQATAMLTSPHTVAVYDYGTTAEGQLYYVMELLQGLDVETLVTRHGPLPTERIVHLLLQACASLAEAHAAGLVHRDIKPANLYLCALGRTSDFLKVLDFGLVRDQSSDVRFTAAGTVSGTPSYLPPETIATNHTDVRSDIYALGCVAYFLMTGRLVFDAQTAPAMMAAHLSEPVIRPSLKTEVPISPALEQVVLACLAKDPGARPQSMDALARRLAEVPVADAWDQGRAHAWWRMHAPEVATA